jgi:hypothetical protein
MFGREVAWGSVVLELQRLQVINPEPLHIGVSIQMDAACETEMILEHRLKPVTLYRKVSSLDRWGLSHA